MMEPLLLHSAHFYFFTCSYITCGYKFAQTFISKMKVYFTDNKLDTGKSYGLICIELIRQPIEQVLFFKRQHSFLIKLKHGEVI